jgi:hypothetical protein
VPPGDAVSTIALAPPPPGTPTGNPETGVSLHTDDIDGYHAELKADGVDVDPRSAAWEIRSRRCSGCAIRKATP